MTTQQQLSLRFVILIAVALMIVAPGVGSEEANGIVVIQPWSRASIMKARPGVVYLTIVNRSSSNERLLSASSPIAGKVMIHESTVSDGIASMRHRKSLPIDAGETVEFKPSGLHLMVVNLTRKLSEGEEFSLSLHFERAGKVTVRVPVLGIGAGSPY